ncbi:unnamed protein product [Heligmosomoides polygyrus]|uniref:TMV resistance protein N-like n=1 Tax=Heligmosomoides polygyrus TaxID=6339 RepID=A0A183FPR2_HELPZ|nr:unnamed protein product [Heligmosomoides polygyrus]
MNALQEVSVEPDVEPQPEETPARRSSRDEAKEKVQELRIINTPESPLGRIERQLQGIKDKTDAIPFFSSRVSFNNELITSVEQRLEAIESGMDKMQDLLEAIKDQGKQMIAVITAQQGSRQNS